MAGETPIRRGLLMGSMKPERRSATLATAAAVACAALLPAATARGVTRTENFDIAPAHWTSLNNNTDGSVYGFSNTNNTGQASGAGEAGGTFARSTTHGYYADPTIGALTQEDFIHGEGEFWFGNGSTANTDGHFGHLDTASAAINFNRNMVGIGIYEGTPESAGFRFAALMFNDVTQEFHPGAVHFPNGQYKFSYDWNPTNDTLTARLFDTAGTLLHTSTAAAPGSTFQLDGFGLSSGINGGGANPAQKYDYFFDAVNYTIGGPATPGWNSSGGGDYHTGSNWIGGVPNAADAVATFGSAISAPSLIQVNAGVTVGGLSFDNANTYLLAGTGGLTMQVTTGSASVSALSGSHKLNVPVTIASNTTITVSAGATLKISDPVTVNSGAALSQGGAGTLVYESTVKLLGGGSLTMSASAAMESLDVAAGASAKVSAGGTSVLSVGALSVAGSVDLGDNKLVTSTPVGAVSDMVASARNGGAWDGPGITTSVGQANDLTTLGVASAGQALNIGDDETAVWAGKNVKGSDTLVAHTWGGDANLDGKIDIDDYGQIDFNVASGGAAAGWFNGDFNYDGKINIDDYGIIDFNVTAQGAALSTGGVAAVPEPAGLSVLLAAAALASRRRRSKA